MSEPGALEGDAGPVGGSHDQELQELDWVDAGHYLGHQLGHDHHQHAGEEPGLKKDGLDPGRDVEEEIAITAVNGGQLGSEEDGADNEDLATHQELLNVVALAGDLAQLVGGGVGLLVVVRVESLELHQSNLESLHHSETPEDEDEYQETCPARHLLPHAGLLLQDGVDDHHSGEQEQH